MAVDSPIQAISLQVIYILMDLPAPTSLSKLEGIDRRSLCEVKRFKDEFDGLNALIEM